MNHAAWFLPRALTTADFSYSALAAPGPDFTIEVNSDGMTMIHCHRLLTPDSLAELRDKLKRLAPDDGELLPIGVIR